MFSTYRDLHDSHPNAQVFRSMAEAEAWLGLGPADDGAPNSI
jgi:hypothetical protein